MKFDTAKILATMKLNESQRDALTALFFFINGGDDWLNVQQVAYFLATTEHETAGTYLPIKEYGGDAYFNKRYDASTKVGKVLGNRLPGDGAKFCGRGYVQLTGRANYEQFGRLLGLPLASDPAQAMDKAVAYQIAVTGMRKGLFTGKSIDKYVNNVAVDYVGGRRVINGTDKAEKIAGHARAWEQRLKG